MLARYEALLILIGAVSPLQDQRPQDPFRTYAQDHQQGWSQCCDWQRMPAYTSPPFGAFQRQLAARIGKTKVKTVTATACKRAVLLYKVLIPETN